MKVQSFFISVCFLIGQFVSAQSQLSVRTELTPLPGNSERAYQQLWRTLGTLKGRTYYALLNSTRKGTEPGVVFVAVGADPEDSERVVVPLRYEDRELTPQAVSLAGGYINLFTSFNNKKTDKSYLLVHRVEAASLEASEEPNVLMSLSGADHRNGDYWSFHMPEQPDYGHIIEYRVDQARNRIDVHYVVLNAELEMHYEHVIEGVDKETYGRLFEVGATPDGTFYYVSAEGGDARRFYSDPGERYLNMIRPDGSSVRQRIETTAGTEPAAPRIRVNPTGNPVAFGKYYDKKKRVYAGLYLQTFDGRTLDRIDSQMIPLTVNERGLLDRGETGKKFDKRARELMEAHKAADILFAEDGSTYLFSELRMGMRYVSPSGMAYPIDYSRGFFVTRIDREGSIGYFRHVPINLMVSQPLADPRWAARPAATVVGNALFVSFYTSARKDYRISERREGKPEGSRRLVALRHVLFAADGSYRSGPDRQFGKLQMMDAFLPGSGRVSPTGDRMYYLAYRDGSVYFASVFLP